MQPLFMNITGFKDFFLPQYINNARLSYVCKPHRSFIKAQYNIYLNRLILGMQFEVKVPIIGQLLHAKCPHFTIQAIHKG